MQIINKTKYQLNYITDDGEMISLEPAEEFDLNFVHFLEYEIESIQTDFFSIDEENFPLFDKNIVYIVPPLLNALMPYRSDFLSTADFIYKKGKIVAFQKLKKLVTIEYMQKVIGARNK